MLHFSLHINGDTVCDVKIRNMGITADERYFLYSWSVTEKETSENKTVTGTYTHDRSCGAIELASQVLHEAFKEFHGKKT